jgi:hypothetical protein
MKKSSITFSPAAKQTLAGTFALLCLLGGQERVSATADTAAVTPAAATEADRLQIHGIFSTRYDHTQEDGVQDFGSALILDVSWKLSEKYTLATTGEFHHCFRDNLPFSNSSDGKLHDWNLPFFETYVKGQFGDTTVKLGQFTYIPAYGLTHGLYQEVSGGLVSFGKNIRTTLVAGTTRPYWPGTSSNSTLSYADGVMQTSPYQAIDVVIPASRATNIRALYEHGSVATPIEAKPYSSPEINFTECGFDTTVAKNLKLEAAIINSTADSSNKGTYASLKYKEANPQQKNSFDTFVTYHDLEANSLMGNDIPLKSDQKGVRYGIHYVPFKNSIVTAWYDDVKVISTNKNNDKIRVQLDVFF